MRKTIVLFVLLATALSLAGSAFASGSGSAKAAYDGPSAKVQSVVKGTKQSGVNSVKGAVASAKPNTLPFTGLDLGVILGGGLVLLTMGASLRRLSRK